MDDYKPNSHRFKEEQKQTSSEKRVVNKVAKGTSRTNKNSGINGLAKVFISEDVGNIKEYVIMDMLVPTLKKTVLGVVDMLLNGGNPTYTSRSSTSKVSYSRFYDEPGNSRNRSESTTTRFDYSDIGFKTRGDAELVLDEMNNILERYGFVSIGDLYDIADMTPPPYTTNKYGWTNLSTARVERAGGDYVIRLPKARPDDRR